MSHLLLMVVVLRASGITISDDFAMRKLQTQLEHAHELIHFQEEEMKMMRQQIFALHHQNNACMIQLMLEREETNMFIDKMQGQSTLSLIPHSSINRASRTSLVSPPCILIKNLPRKWTQSEIKGYFSEFGLIESVTFSGPKSSKNHGKAFVQFANTKDAHKCVHGKNGCVLLGKVLKVSHFNKPKLLVTV